MAKAILVGRQSGRKRGRLRMVTKAMRSIWCSCSPPRTTDAFPVREKCDSAPASTSVSPASSPSPPPPMQRPSPLRRTKTFGPQRLTEHFLDKPFQLRPPVGKSKRRSYEQSPRLSRTLRKPYNTALLVFWIIFFAFGALAWYLQHLEEKNSSSWWT